MARPKEIDTLQKQIWAGSLPLEIRLSATESRIYDQTDPYLIHYPRLGYLPFLLPRLHAFFTPFLIDPTASQPHDGWFSFEDVPLKWHHPIGLLFDLLSGAEPISAGGVDGGETSGQGRLPWRLTVHFTEYPDERLIRLDAEGKVMHDAFINSVKEADFLRNGTAKGIMSLSKEDSTTLWQAVQDHDLPVYTTISQKLLNPPGSHLRHVPLKIYLPSTTSSLSEPGSLRVIQGLVPLHLSNRERQTIGTALHTLLPTLFPSRRTVTLAQPVLHGAVLPMMASAEEVMRGAAYADGWVHLGVVMMG